MENITDIPNIFSKIGNNNPIQKAAIQLTAVAADNPLINLIFMNILLIIFPLFLYKKQYITVPLNLKYQHYKPKQQAL